MWRIRKLGALAISLVAFSSGPVWTAEPSPAELRFFETHVRPVLATRCYRCHAAEKQKGGLRLDSREGLLAGGDSGPVVVPGKPQESLLISAVGYADEALQMPPNEKLPEREIEPLRQWVLQGAAYPDIAASPADDGGDFWSFQSPRDPSVPSVKDSNWPRSPLDNFILAELERRALSPAPAADKPTLLRRATYDLTGLPPTPDEIDAFLADDSPNAFATVVDRLLASPHYGPRWGRHWLDVARYADSNGMDENVALGSAWRYRDYVVAAFNHDKPYDEFLQEQIAGDLLPPTDVAAVKHQRLIATGFLAIGPKVLAEVDEKKMEMDIVDEQLDTFGRAILGLTLGCARCHDHKFDPIPTRDYYALAGILRSTKTLEHANVSNWIEMPLPLSPEEEQAIGRREAAIAALEAAIKTLSGTRRGVAAAKDLPGIVVDDRDAKRVGQWQLSQFNGSYIGDGYLHDLNQEKGLKTLTFLPQLAQAGLYEVRLAYTPASNRATNAPVTVVSADGEKLVRINERVEPPLEGRFVSLGEFHFEVNGQGFVIVANEATDGHVIADAVQFLPVGTDLQRSALADPQSVDPQRAAAELKQLERDLKQLKLAGPTRPKVMTVAEEKEVGDTSVHIRGNVHNMAERVPRGFLGAASNGPSPPIPDHESGRRQLAEWLAQPDNPLTARVLVNRVWHWLFGAGLVRTTDNFGTAGEPPSHPELLDYLARRFIDEGWSIKKLVRRIVVSHAYRLSTAADGPARAADPENRLLAHAPRKRLDAESLRDAMLALSGQLDRTAGGRTITPGVTADYGYQQGGHRRSVYMPVFRNALPDIFQAFDFADPSTVTGVRTQSTTPQQALFFMNHPFVADCSRRAAAMLLAMPGLDDGDRIERSYRQALARRPTASEVSIALRFVESMSSRGAPPLDAWSQYWQALFASLDFRYVD
jgi:hypothetical protein